MIKEIIDSVEKRKITKDILNLLPEYFGIESATQHYIESVADLPFFVYYIDYKAVGFVALKPHHTIHMELYVMGVIKEYHRQGIGKALVDAAKTYCQKHHIKYFSVKTLDDAHKDPHYQKTRLFYRKMGFEPLETFPTLWDQSNPCLYSIMVI